MSHLDEPTSHSPTTNQNEVVEPSDSDSLRTHVRKLEAENANLKADLNAMQTQHEADRAVILSMVLSDLPKDENEYQAFAAANSASFSELLREMEAKFGLESPK